jgi:hypothetical protein
MGVRKRAQHHASTQCDAGSKSEARAIGPPVSNETCDAPGASFNRSLALRDSNLPFSRGFIISVAAHFNFETPAQRSF